MRISDWSSDVCSSDLRRVQNVLGRHQRARVLRRAPRRFLRHVSRVRFGGGREIETGLDDGELALGRSEEVIGVLGGEALDQSLWIGEADILRRGAGEAAEEIEDRKSTRLNSRH